MQEPGLAGTAPSLDNLRAQGFASHERGDLLAAERAYCQLLSNRPTDFEVMHALASLAMQRRQFERAVTLLEEVLRTRRTAAVHADMGNALSGLGRWSEAIAHYTQATTWDPTLALAHLNCGQAQRALGRHRAALDCYGAALRVAPQLFEGWITHADLAAELGSHAEAIASYQRALELRPDSADAHFRLSLLLAGAGGWEAALQSIEQALNLGLQTAAVHTLHGVYHANRGHFESAIESYRRALAQDPTCVAAHINLGAALRRLRRTDDALTSFDAALALDPMSVEALSNRAAALIDLRRFEAALSDADRALGLQSDRPEIHLNRAAALQHLRHYEDALDSCDRALELAPDSADAHFNRGTALQALNRAQEALESYERTLAMDDGHAEAFGNRGMVLHELGKLPEALASFDRAIERKADYAEAYSNRGNVLKDMNRLEESLASHDRALEFKPDLADAHFNRGTVLQAMDRSEDALASYERALALDDTHADAHFNRSVVLLSRGDYSRGFAAYEWRARATHGRKARQREYREPLWLGGEALDGKTILLHAEQGLGDSIQFCRYVPLVARRGARVVLQVPRPLAGLLATLEGVAQVRVDEEEEPTCDYHCPLLSLPLATSTSLETIPSQVPYLHPDAGILDQWRQRLGSRSRPRVGLVWSGGVRPWDRDARATNERRNLPLVMLAPLKHTGIDFYSLQKGEPAESELGVLQARGWDGPELIDHSARLTDFAQTAALIAQLDLVISVDTATAHLAGALGRPVWILNRFDSCWRWLAGRSDSPWYPSARLYRQASPGDWAGVVRRVAADLTTLIDAA